MNILSEVLSHIGFEGRKIGHGCEMEKRISTHDVQKAFLENLHIAGYFNEDSIAQAVHFIRRQNHNNHDSFEKIMEILAVCGASEKHPQKFNANILFDNFSHHGSFLSEIDLKNIIVFLARKAFGRAPGQERSELQRQLWAEVYGHNYLENAEKLGLILQEKPPEKKYDETWIQGSAYHNMRDRVLYAKSLQDEGYDLGFIRLLSGERELWLEIDRISEEQLILLAKKNNIKVVGFEKRQVNHHLRTYLKYGEGERRKVTEGMAAREIYSEVFNVEINDDLVIDAKIHDNASRVTTASVTADLVNQKFAAKILNNQFLEKEIKILIVTNQPHVERQTLTNKRVALGELKKYNIKQKIIFHGAGRKSISSIAEIHSEFGALVSEKYMQQLQNDKAHMIKILRKISK